MDCDDRDGSGQFSSGFGWSRVVLCSRVLCPSRMSLSYSFGEKAGFSVHISKPYTFCLLLQYLQFS